MRTEVETDASGRRSRPTSQIGLPAASSRVTSRATSPAPGDDQAEWARQEQQVRVFSSVLLSAPNTNQRYGPCQMIIRQQDQTLDTIGGTLTTLAEQAGLMGREIMEHNEYVHPRCCATPPTDIVHFT